MNTLNRQVELYIEKTRSGIEVSGTIDNEYVELRFQEWITNRSFVDGIYANDEIKPVVRTYGELCGQSLETNEYGYWKPTKRKKIVEEMYDLLTVVENFMLEHNYVIAN